MGKSPESAKDIVRERAGGRCEKCGEVLTRNRRGNPDRDTDKSTHHRQPQRAGGRDSVINMVDICLRCHREIHEDEETAAGVGWIVLNRNPGNAPFLGWQGWVLPDNDGGLALVDFEAGSVSVLRTPARTTRSRRVATRARPGCRKSRKRVA